MKKDIIYRHIKKICLLSLAISAVSLSIIIFIIFQIPFNDIFFPTPMSYASSASTVYNSNAEYVEVVLSDVKYTGYDCKLDGKVYASYYYSLINNTCTFILVKNSSKHPLPEVLDDYSVTARLIPIDKKAENMIDNFSKDINWTKDGLDKVTSPVLIDETSYYIDIYYYLAICFFVICLMLVSFIIINIIYVFVPAFYPACLTFNRLSTGHHAIAHVNYELTSRVILKSGNISLTENYIVATGPLSIEIIPINKIIWAYEHSTWSRILWFKIKLTYTLHLLCEHRIYTYSPRNTKKNIDIVLQYLKDNYPNIIFGYTKNNKLAAYKKLKKAR